MAVFRQACDLPAAPAAVFAALREPARLARGWGPDGVAYPNQAEFLEIVPDARVRIRHVNLPHVELAIRLEPVATGTRLGWAGVFENRDFAGSRRPVQAEAHEQTSTGRPGKGAAGGPEPPPGR